jgi:hypothetical protein
MDINKIKKAFKQGKEIFIVLNNGVSGIVDDIDGNTIWITTDDGEDVEVRPSKIKSVEVNERNSILGEIFKKIMETKINVKNVEEGELIRPIDKIELNAFKDKELTKKIEVTLTKEDEIEIISTTEHDIVGYVKNKDVYVVLSKYDLEDFEDVE